jgi:hypothetical protein
MAATRLHKSPVDDLVHGPLYIRVRLQYAHSRHIPLRFI